MEKTEKSNVKWLANETLGHETEMRRLTFRARWNLPTVARVWDVKKIGFVSEMTIPRLHPWTDHTCVWHHFSIIVTKAAEQYGTETV